MATTVTVLCPNGRRVAVKVTPSTALLKVCRNLFKIKESMAVDNP